MEVTLSSEHHCRMEAVSRANVYLSQRPAGHTHVAIVMPSPIPSSD
jgi:hypothetical protein